MIEYDDSLGHAHIAFIGHVDAGKSTISGNILLKTGYVDERTIEKYQKEAKTNKKESWYLAYIMDLNEEERKKGKTVEVGKAYFSLKTKRFTLLDVPGHGSFLPNMIQGSCQADIAGLVISAKSGEFEAGFDEEKEGKTREHTLITNALGVTKLIVLINKMDEESVNWDEERFLEIQKQLTKFVIMCGYSNNDVFWIPISGLKGDNLFFKSADERAQWYKGPALFDVLEGLDLPKWSKTGGLRIPILDKYSDQGDYLMGKIEQGTIRVGKNYILLPSKIVFELVWLFNNEEKGIPYSEAGESVRLKIKPISKNFNLDNIQIGDVVSSLDDLCPTFTLFEAEVNFLELNEDIQVISNGFSCIIHMQTLAIECTVIDIHEVDKTTKEVDKKSSFVKSHGQGRCFIQVTQEICGEKFEVLPSIGRFTLRRNDRTIGFGKILRYKPTK